MEHWLTVIKKNKRRFKSIELFYSFTLSLETINSINALFTSFDIYIEHVQSPRKVQFHCTTMLNAFISIATNL